MAEYYNDPKSFLGIPLTQEEIDDKKSSIEDGLRKLRGE